MERPILVKPGEFTFFETLPGSYESIRFKYANKKLTPQSLKIFVGVQSFINRLIHLRRNYKPAAFKQMSVRLYPREEFEQDDSKMLYSFILEGKDCNSDGDVIVALYPPYVLDNEYSIYAKVFAEEVTAKEAKDVLKEDARRRAEQEEIKRANNEIFDDQ